MKKYYAKSLPEYEGLMKLDGKKILRSIRALKKSVKLPTSILLEKDTIKNLKALAEKKGVSYQAFVQTVIAKGLKHIRK